MKKIIAIMLALSVLLSFVACTKNASPDKQDDSVQDPGIPNPIVEVSADEMEFAVNVPENATEVKYSIIDDGEGKINQVDYKLDGKDYTYRMESTGEVAAYDISGIYSDNWESENVSVSYCDAVAMTSSEGSVIYWLDLVPGINYTLSCSQKLSAEELSEAATALFAPMQGDAAGDEDVVALSEGHYEDNDFNSVDVKSTDTDAYEVMIALYRLATFEGEGNWEEGSLKFTVEAPDGSSVDGRFFPSIDGEGYSLVFTDSQWELVESGTSFDGFILSESVPSND